MRSKNVHVIKYRTIVRQMNNPNSYAAYGELDVATILSQNLGRTIKQNQNFRITGWGAYLTPAGGGEDLDGGMSATVRLGYCPTTKWSVKGHKMLQDQYWKQSNFRKGLGANSKYDEFEVSMYSAYASDRTSEVFVGGINDPLAEKCSIYGGYDDEDGLGQGYIAMQRLVDAKYPLPAAGNLVEDDLLFDDQIAYKPAKFTTRFPLPQYLASTATMSASYFYDTDILVDDIYDTQGISMDTLHHLPADNHVNVLCGRMQYHVWTLPRDDENINADGAYINIVLIVEGWSPLHAPKRRKSLPRRYKARKSLPRRRYYRRSKS